MKTYNGFLLSIFFLTGVELSYAQDDNLQLENLIKEDSIDVSTIAAYPDPIRNSIFWVATQHEAIIYLGDIQKKASDNFRQLILLYPKDKQNEIYNLTRYDGLIDQLVNNPNKAVDIESILKAYPAEVHDNALYYAQHQPELLNKIDIINKDFLRDYNKLVKNFSAETKSAFDAALKEPEAINMLNENMRMTVRLGDIYLRNPELVKHKFDSLSLEIARQKAKDVADWKETMQNNPEAANELKKSAKEFASQQGYNENEYKETNPEVIVEYRYYPYPYWCGYPWWYEYNYWYPYPYWYHWGFYFWSGNIIWLGPPSWYYVNWHFYHYNHCYEYPYITSACISHYYGHHRTSGRSSVVVNKWVVRNEKVFPEDFIRNEKQMPERLKEYGKFEKEYTKQVLNNKQPVSRDEFMKQHSSDYPALQPVENENVPVHSIPEKQQYPEQKNAPVHNTYQKAIPPTKPTKSPSAPVIKPPVRQEQKAPVYPKQQVAPPPHQNPPPARPPK